MGTWIALGWASGVYVILAYTEEASQETEVSLIFFVAGLMMHGYLWAVLCRFPQTSSTFTV
jgi:hypothetical protein